MKPFRAHLLVLFLLSASLLSAGPPPDPADPLIIGPVPSEALHGQQVLINGLNFGSAPQVTVHGTPATVVGHRPGSQALIVTVPAGASSGTGPLVVTNTTTMDTSNVAELTVLPGSYVPACTISGTLSDPGMAAAPGGAVVAFDFVTNDFVAADIADLSGNYALGLPAGGAYSISILPPLGSTLVTFSTSASCPTTLNHQFSSGSPVTGTVRVNQVPFDPIPNALVQLSSETVDQGHETTSDATGAFTIYVPDDSYELLVMAPPGRRYVYHQQAGVVVSGGLALGNLDLDSGWLLSGTVQRQDGSDSGPYHNAYLVLFDQLGPWAGISRSIADGQFWLPAPANSNYLMAVAGGSRALDLFVNWIDLPADTELDYSLTAYSADPQIPELPTISGGDSTIAQENQPFVVEAVNIAGSAVEVSFSDGGGGRIDGVETHVFADRGVAITKVPAGASSGPVQISVDGVDSVGVPITIAPGVFDPGPYTISGVVTDGSGPLADTLVVAVIPGCPDEILGDYDLTSSGGNYSVDYAGGDVYLYVLPPISSGVAPQGTLFSGLSGNQTIDVPLQSGHQVSVRAVDSGVGPVGLAGSPIPNALAEVESIDEDFDDGMLTDGAGQATLNVPTGEHWFAVSAPFQSRYLVTDTTQVILDDFDFGDVPLDSGYFIEGRVVDPGGSGIAGVDVGVVDTFNFEFDESTFTADETGSFRIAVPPGTYQLFFEAPPEMDYFIPPVWSLEITTDTALYPAVSALDAGHVTGTVYLPDGVTPADDLQVSASLADTFDWINADWTCFDGTYDLRVPAASYVIEVDASWDDPCLADEYHDGVHYSCEATPVDVSTGGTTAGIDFTLDPAGSVSGRVEDNWGSPLAYAFVCIDEGPASPPCKLRCANTDFDGNYVLDSIPVGSGYRVSVETDGYPTECWNDRPTCSTYDPVTVGECMTTSGIDVSFSDAAGPVPDGFRVAGTPMLMTYDQLGNLLTFHWQPTCSATGHVLYLGNLDSIGTYTQAICDIGVDGELALDSTPNDIFWIIVGKNGSNEGSYGFDSNGFQRPGIAGSLCGLTQDLSATCLP